MELGRQGGPKASDVEGGLLKVVMVKGAGMAVARAGPSPQVEPEADGPEPDEYSAMNGDIAYRICRGDDLADAVLKGNLKWAKKLAKESREILEAEAEGGWGPSLDTFFIPVSDAEDLALAWKHLFGRAGRRERTEKIAASLASLGPEDRRDVREASSRLDE